MGAQIARYTRSAMIDVMNKPYKAIFNEFQGVGTPDADADNYASFYKGQKCFIEVVYLGEDKSENSWLEADGTDTIKDMKSRIAKEKGIDNSNAIEFIFRKKGDGKSMKFADDTTFETVMMEYWGKDQSCRIQMNVDMEGGGKRAHSAAGDDDMGKFFKRPVFQGCSSRRIQSQVR